MQHLFLFFAILLPVASGFSIQSINLNPPTKIQLQQQEQQAALCSITRQKHISSHTRRRSNSNGDNRRSGALLAAEVSNSNSLSKGEEEEEEWEFEEYELLTETDFYDSEWKVGTLMEGSNKIEETWTRLVVKDGEFICVWGDGANGKWNFDGASQFLSMSKDSFGGWLGKRIWAGTIDDYYYAQGTIRGWNPLSPASVVGQWQAKRLGVDKDEAGIAPWFEEDEDDDSENSDSVEMAVKEETTNESSDKKEE